MVYQQRPEFRLLIPAVISRSSRPTITNCSRASAWQGNPPAHQAIETLLVGFCSTANTTGSEACSPLPQPVLRLKAGMAARPLHRIGQQQLPMGTQMGGHPRPHRAGLHQVESRPGITANAAHSRCGRCAQRGKLRSDTTPHAQHACGEQLDGGKRRHANGKAHVLVMQPALQTQHPGERQRAQPPHPGRIGWLHSPLHLWRNGMKSQLRG